MRVMNLLLILTFLLPVRIAAEAVTPDGRYVWASVNKTMDATGQILVIQSTADGWKKEIPGVFSARFTGDGRKALYLKSDTLFMLTLGTGRQAFIPQVSSYELIGTGSAERLLYRTKGPDRELVVRELDTGKEIRTRHVAGYVVSANGRDLLVTVTTASNGDSTTTLQRLQLMDGRAQTLWTGTNVKIGMPVFDGQSRQVAFLVLGKRSGANAIWWHRAGMNEAQLLVQDGSPGIDSGLAIDDQPISFSERGERLFFRLKEVALPQAEQKAAFTLNVWSYLDPKLQSQQRKDLILRSYSATVGLSDRRILRIEKENEVVLGSPGAVQGWLEGEKTDRFALVARFAGDVLTFDLSSPNGYSGGLVDTYTLNEYKWNRATRTSVYLVSLTDGSRTVLKERIQPSSASFPYYRFSPGGRYVVYYDEEEQEYLSYEIATGTRRELTKGAGARWALENPGAAPLQYYRPAGIEAWIGDDRAMLVRDHYSDLWRVDLRGRVRPVNITNGYARRHDIRLARPYGSSSQLGDTDTLMLVASRGTNSRRYRNPGIVRAFLDRPRDPEMLLGMGGRYKYGLTGKAAAAEVYVVTRQNAEVPPGIFYTRDFQTFTPVTSSQPEQRRRGFSRELITWTQLDGTESQGILLKPEGFDPKKKYPIIFYLYEIQTNEFADFFSRLREDDDYTAHGYLVFKPDIHYTIGEAMPSVVNSVVSAARHLAATYPFIDSTRMGLRGHSFGGFETNYLVTHSNIFAAAVSGAGGTNYFSYYGAEPKDEQGYSYMAHSETGQGRLGSTPWERPDLYMLNSAVYTADKTTTPLLLYHSETDYRVPFSQSVELFIALRRLGKPVWLLQYEGTGHLATPPSDFTIREMQFFDHYLKGAPAPVWMTRGIPFRRRGIDLGLELDSLIKTPPPGGLLWKEESKTPQQKKLVKQGRP